MLYELLLSRRELRLQRMKGSRVTIRDMCRFAAAFALGTISAIAKGA